MKKIILLMLIVSSFISCDHEPVIYDTPEGFLQFPRSSASVQENSADGIVVEVLFGGSSNPDGVTVGYEITGDNLSRLSSPTSGTVTIPAGEFRTEIVIVPSDNFEADGNATFNVELTTESSVPVGLGGEGINLNSLSLTLIDDDCPITIADWVGTYSVSEVFTGGNNEGLSLAAAFGETYQVEISLAPNDPTGTKVILNNSAGYNTFFRNGTVMSFLSCSGTISFVDNPVIAEFGRHAIESSSYNEDSFVIKADGPLGVYGPYQWVLTKI